ncbi:MAG TPA: hypothetical protein VNZ64_20385 [Candidatus Acidoferrum sp.]|nr:hypothetical protein [Candidatus Acidoferrum sp.]
MNPIRNADEAARFGVGVSAGADARKELCVSTRPLSGSQVRGSGP